MENKEKPGLTLDTWQQEVLDTKGNKCIRSGRQVGKSTVISIDAGEYAIKYPKKTILIVAAVERQALLLFEKVLGYIYNNHRDMIKKGKDKPTKHTLRLKNGSTIHCLPTGLDGYGIRGYTIDRLYADEAAFIPDAVWNAVTPMLATTKGDIILLSTPFGKEGYFYRCYNNDSSFKTFHISSEDCERIPKDFLKLEKERMSKVQYTQEYLGEFVDELMQLFPNKLIIDCMKLSRRTKEGTIIKKADYFIGVDIARMGEDEITYEILERRNGMLYHVENIVKTKELTTMTTRKIVQLDRQYDFRRIFIDDGGLGAGIFDQLLEDRQTRRKVIAINNLKKAIEHNPDKDPRKRKLLKEELYDNLLRLMEQGKILLLDDPEIYQSLKSVQYEYGRDNRGESRIRIYGNYTHITEGLIRAAWCMKDKSLNIFIL